MILPKTKKWNSLTSHHYIYAHEDSVRNFGQIDPDLEKLVKTQSGIVDHNQNQKFWIIYRVQNIFATAITTIASGLFN